MIVVTCRSSGTTEAGTLYSTWRRPALPLVHDIVVSFPRSSKASPVAQRSRSSASGPSMSSAIRPPENSPVTTPRP